MKKSNYKKFKAVATLIEDYDYNCKAAELNNLILTTKTLFFIKGSEKKIEANLLKSDAQTAELKKLAHHFLDTLKTKKAA